MKIVTHYDPKPIPDRAYDWCAYDDNTYDQGQPIGWGETEKEAIADLTGQLQARQRIANLMNLFDNTIEQIKRA